MQTYLKVSYPSINHAHVGYYVCYCCTYNRMMSLTLSTRAVRKVRRQVYNLITIGRINVIFLYFAKICICLNIFINKDENTDICNIPITMVT
jgi:hypothetical protein